MAIVASPFSILSRGPSTTASFQFIDCPPNDKGDQKFYAGVLDAPDGITKLSPVKKTIHDIPVSDLRGSEAFLSLDVHGLQFLRYPQYQGINVNSDQGEIMSYLGSITAKVKSVFGAELAFCYDYKFRRNMNYLPDDDFNQILKDLALTNDRSVADPASFMTHVDATPVGAMRRLRRYLSPNECIEYLDQPDKYRVRIMNVWRPVAQAVYDRPLGICDFFSTVPEDFVPVQFHTSTENVGEVYWLRHNENQRWYYISGHTPEELLLFLNYDSDYRSGPKCIPHCSFQHADFPDESNRQSLELRLAVITKKRS
ncbi:hypothetical protein F5Y15DRAFT_91752 [Xylariaceae sp. FL0016]|nr:hypothetical protein F5Y15DRAFT_91752 [Xylariaceae sp. FL0016]